MGRKQRPSESRSKVLKSGTKWSFRKTSGTQLYNGRSAFGGAQEVDPPGKISSS